MNKKDNLLEFFKKNYILISFIYLSINIYFQRYIPVGIYLIFTLYTLFFSDNLRIKKYLEDKRQNDANLMYHYRNNTYLNIIFIFTRSVYGLAFINFICQGLPIFQKYSVHIFYTIVFALLIDFLACAYIIRYKNFFTKTIYLVQTYGPKVLTVFFPSYAAYAISNPTNPISHPFHLHGPRVFGALGAAPYSEIHLTQIDHIRTIYPHNSSIGLYLDPNNVPNLSITKYRIHSDPIEYIRWRNALPMQHWFMYGLDKPIGDALTEDVLVELKYHGVVGKASVLEQIKSRPRQD